MVKNAPIVIADRRTVLKDDLVEVDNVMEDKVSKTGFIYHRPNQKWFWLADQTPEEIAMFATWTPDTPDMWISM